MVEGDWTCLCGANLDWYEDYCGQCGKNRYYVLTQPQARAVARELNKLETENKGLSAMLAASTLHVARPHQKMRCGHERRFVVTGDDGDIGELRGTTQWCALCGLEGLRAELREYHAAERWAEEATDETD